MYIHHNAFAIFFFEKHVFFNFIMQVLQEHEKQKNCN
jgi:hypothetical protein